MTVAKYLSCAAKPKGKPNEVSLLLFLTIKAGAAEPSNPRLRSGISCKVGYSNDEHE